MYRILSIFLNKTNVIEETIIKLTKKFSNYAWDTNFGYGTKAHLDGLRKFGVTAHHRKGFKPVHKILSS